jgi:hypothetical protein
MDRGAIQRYTTAPCRKVTAADRLMSTNLVIDLVKDKPLRNWAEYYRAIRECDRLRGHKYPVFASQKTSTSGRNLLMSWIDTIKTGKTVIERTTDWAEPSESDIAVLFGYKCDRGGLGTSRCNDKSDSSEELLQRKSERGSSEDTTGTNPGIGRSNRR